MLLPVQLRALAVVLLVLVPTALASSGDRSVPFQTCLADCEANHCLRSPTPLPFILRATRWSCLDNCKYICSHEITDQALGVQKSIEQFYGKWAFWRLFGMQEPASVAFSLSNLWVHLKGLSLIQTRIPDAHPMKIYYTVWGTIGANAWIWSSVFHIRDTPMTEKLDYFSASLTILSSLFVTVVRIFHLYSTRLVAPIPSHPINNRGHINRTLHVWFLLCAFMYIGHVSYLSFSSRFDYGYNIIANVFIGSLHNVIWVVYSLPMLNFRRFPYPSTTRSPSSVSRPGWIALSTTLASVFEVFDFPPWGRVIDAHSLWHLCTVPAAYFWYRYLVEDALDEGWLVVKL